MSATFLASSYSALLRTETCQWIGEADIDVDSFLYLPTKVSLAFSLWRFRIRMHVPIAPRNCLQVEPSIR